MVRRLLERQPFGQPDLVAHARHRTHEIFDHAVGLGMIDIEPVELPVAHQVDARPAPGCRSRPGSRRSPPARTAAPPASPAPDRSRPWWSGCGRFCRYLQRTLIEFPRLVLVFRRCRQRDASWHCLFFGATNSKPVNHPVTRGPAPPSFETHRFAMLFRMRNSYQTLMVRSRAFARRLEPRGLGRRHRQ